MNTEQFIKDAIAGGWKSDEIERCTIHFIHENANDGAKNCLVIDNSYTCSVDGERHDIAKHYSIGDILLDHLAWQAVGKTRGWPNDITAVEDRKRVVRMPQWQYNIHRFIDHLADGKTVDEALAAIS